MVQIPQAVIDAADTIKHLNYKTSTPAKFKTHLLTEDIAGGLMAEVADIIGIDKSRLDYVYFSCSQGAEPHTDVLPVEKFESTTFVIPVILPKGKSVIFAKEASQEVQVGKIYEFNHEETHSMTLEDKESGCVVIMVAVLHEVHECKYCGSPSGKEPDEQTRPADYCHPVDHQRFS
jgi:hypothetical protein